MHGELTCALILLFLNSVSQIVKDARAGPGSFNFIRRLSHVCVHEVTTSSTSGVGVRSSSTCPPVYI